MIDKEQIKMSVEKRSCVGLQSCYDCPIINWDGPRKWRCGNKDGDGLRPRTIRILQQWLDENY